VRLSPRPTAETLPYYYPEDEYYSFQIVPENLPRKLGGLKGLMREAVLSRHGYPCDETLPLKLVRPIATRLFFERATYGLGEKLPRYVEGGRALDIGCGSGRLLNLLKILGWDVRGVEMSETAAATAKKMFDIDVFVGALEDCPFEKHSFDFINMSHVIEHFPDPLMVMKCVSSLLKPGGIVYIETPNILGSASSRSLSIWYPTESPRHLFLFNPENLTSLVERAGLAVSKIAISNYDFTDWEGLYELENLDGKCRPDRDKILAQIRSRTVLERFLKKVSLRLRPGQGNIIGCWASSS
jgi:2-polyprenyl-3-methyl-5-hydroxy-6-metoxy-1,4-benzoquinol methylase